MGYEEKRSKKKRKCGWEAKEPTAMFGYLDNCENRMDDDLNHLIIRLIARGVKNKMVRVEARPASFVKWCPPSF
jgi:hypothetical protein